MLMLVGYDLRDPRYYNALTRGMQRCGDAFNIRSAPRFVETDKTPREVCQILVDELTAAEPTGLFNDTLLVIPLGQQPCGAHHELEEPAAWLSGHGADMRGNHAARHFAVAYTLHAGDENDRRDYRPVMRAVEALGDAARPVHALWFVTPEAGTTAGEICTGVHSRGRLRATDQVLVFEVSRRGAAVNLEDPSWFLKHGIRLEMLPAPKRQAA